MAFLYGKSAQQVTLQSLGGVVLAVADGVDILTVPFDGYLERVHMAVGDGGAVGNNTDVVVEYTKPTGGLSTSGDMWTIGAGVGRIAHDATEYLEWDRDSCLLYFVERGGTLSLNVNAIPDTASKDLTVHLYIQPLDRE
jgi:hypothetical protein